jgi:hypothetical protein
MAIFRQRLLEMDLQKLEVTNLPDADAARPFRATAPNPISSHLGCR